MKEFDVDDWMVFFLQIRFFTVFFIVILFRFTAINYKVTFAVAVFGFTFLT